MKKTFIVSMALSLILVGMGFSETKTEVTPSVNAGETLIDLESVAGKTKDNIRFISAIEEKQSFVVKYYDSTKNSWNVFGSAELVGYGDTAFVDSSIHIKKHRYYAVSSKGNYNYTYAAHNKDLYITVSSSAPEAQPDKSKATIIDANAINGSFKHNIRVFNNTSTPNPKFVVYGFNNEGDAWTKIGNASPKKINYDAMVRTPLNEVNTFNFYAILSADENNYNFSAVKKDHDLFITATDK